MEDVSNIASKYMNLTLEQIQSAYKDKNTPAVDLVVLKILYESIKKGDASRLKFLLDKSKNETQYEDGLDDILFGKKAPELAGLVGSEQPLFFYGPPPAIRILNQMKHEFDSEFHPFDLIKHMQEGSSRSEICAAWGITYQKFNEWLDRYHEMAEAYAMGKPAYDGYYKRALRFSAFGQMKSVRENSLFFMLKNQAGFSDQGGDHEYGDGEGAEVEFVDDQDDNDV